jgi:hypothetical protein
MAEKRITKSVLNTKEQENLIELIEHNIEYLKKRS